MNSNRDLKMSYFLQHTRRRLDGPILPKISAILSRNYLSNGVIFGDKWNDRDSPKKFGKIMDNLSFYDDASF